MSIAQVIFHTRIIYSMLLVHKVFGKKYTIEAIEMIKNVFNAIKARQAIWHIHIILLNQAWSSWLVFSVNIYRIFININDNKHKLITRKCVIIQFFHRSNSQYKIQITTESINLYCSKNVWQTIKWQA